MLKIRVLRRKRPFIMSLAQLLHYDDPEVKFCKLHRLWSTLAVCTALIVSAGAAYALPSLQLDATGGTYDSSSSTIIAGQNPFTVYALLDTTKISGSGTFYISAAIVPKTTVGSFGSFTVNGTTYSSGSGMQYGNPPVDATGNKNDLPAHGVYDTYYAEIAFTFDSSKKAIAYDTQYNPGGFTEGAGTLLYNAFNIDMSGLSAGYTVHFDLYNITTDKKGNIAVDQFAPFSHDAQGPGGPSTSIPDSASTMMLLGIGLVAIEGFRRRFAK